MEQSFGVTPPEQAAAMTGLEFLQAMLAGRVPAPPIARTIGMRLVEVGPGHAVFEAEPGEHLLNPLGWVHGGLALALVDTVTGCSLHSRLPAGTSYTTIETKVNFTRPISATGGRVRAEGKLLSLGRQIATAEGRVTSADGKLLAHGTSTLILFPVAAAAASEA